MDPYSNEWLVGGLMRVMRPVERVESELDNRGKGGQKAILGTFDRKMDIPPQGIFWKLPNANCLTK